MLLAGGDVLLRPPCPANYVRLIDFTAIVLVFEALALTGSGALALATWRGRASVWVAASAAAFGTLGLLGLVLETLYLVVVKGDSCWTF